MFRKCRSVLFILVVLCGTTETFGKEAGIQEPNEDGQFSPYIELPVSEAAVTKGLDRRILFFVDFNCPFCRGFHQPILSWASTIPREFEFEVIPAIGMADHLQAALAYYAVLEVAPERLKVFTGTLYSMLQDHHRSVLRATTYVDAAVRAGIDKESFIKGTQSRNVRAYVKRASELTRAYGLNETPSVVIGNRFLTAPRSTQNQLDQFMMVMNGLVSMLYNEIRRTSL